MASLEEELETLAEEVVINTQHCKAKKRRVSCGRKERLSIAIVHWEGSLPKALVSIEDQRPKQVLHV